MARHSSEPKPTTRLTPPAETAGARRPVNAAVASHEAHVRVQVELDELVGDRALREDPDLRNVHCWMRSVPHDGPMAAVRLSRTLEVAWFVHRWLYRLSGGRIGRRINGFEVLLLTTRGRRSGELRRVALQSLEHGEGWAVIASYAGEDRHPSWWLNLRAEPMARRAGQEPARARSGPRGIRRGTPAAVGAVRGDRRRVRGVHAAHDPNPAGRGARAHRLRAQPGEATSEAEGDLAGDGSARSNAASRRSEPGLGTHRLELCPRLADPPAQLRLVGEQVRRVDDDHGGFESLLEREQDGARLAEECEGVGGPALESGDGPSAASRSVRNISPLCVASAIRSAVSVTRSRSRAQMATVSARPSATSGFCRCSSHAAVVRRKAVIEVTGVLGAVGVRHVQDEQALRIGAVADELGDVGLQLIGVEAARALEHTEQDSQSASIGPHRRGIECLVQDGDVLVQVCARRRGT